MPSLQYYIVNVRAGRELFLHELFEKNGYTVYTPFEQKFQHARSRKARAARAPARAYAEALFSTYLFVGSDKDTGRALLGIEYVINRRADAYSFMVSNSGDPLILTSTYMSAFKSRLDKDNEKKSNIFIRGYDPKRDSRKNQTRLYGQESVIIPVFDEGDAIKFMSGSWQGITAKISESKDGKLKVIADLFGSKRILSGVDPFEVQKV